VKSKIELRIRQKNMEISRDLKQKGLAIGKIIPKSAPMKEARMNLNETGGFSDEET